MQAGAPGRIKLGTFDMNQTNLDRIKSGAQLFSIDQQPYLQGFLAVSLLDNHVNFGTELPTKPVLTGPAIVDASNVDKTSGTILMDGKEVSFAGPREASDVASPPSTNLAAPSR
jgi:ABC-type sugar transport system substrate-binding protein